MKTDTNISVDVKSHEDGTYDVFIATENSSGAYYPKIDANTIGVKVAGLIDSLEEKAAGKSYLKVNAADTVSTHNIAADIVEMFEDILENNDVTIPSPEDDEKEEDNSARLYGSVYSNLLDSVENILVAALEAFKEKQEYVQGQFLN